MSHGNLPKVVDKIDPYNSVSLKKQRRGSEGSTTRFRTKSSSELKALPLLKGKFCFVAFCTSCANNIHIVGTRRTRSYILHIFIIGMLIPFPYLDRPIPGFDRDSVLTEYHLPYPLWCACKVVASLVVDNSSHR